MRGLLRSELIKLHTTRTAAGFGAAALLLLLTSTVLSITLADVADPATQRSALAGGGSVAILVMVFGIVGAAGEHRHGTIVPALLITPDRVSVTMAKLLTYGAAGLVAGALAQAVAFAVGIPLLDASDAGRLLAARDLLELAAGGVLAASTAAVIGVGIGALIRDQTLAVVVALVWFLGIEQLVAAVAGDLARYGPNGSLSALAGTATAHPLPWGAAALISAAWALALCAAALAADSARDVD
jgi:hypothetical protein